MPSNCELADSIKSLARQYESICKSDEAMKGEDLDGIRAIDHGSLAELAWDALRLAQALVKGQYEYSIAMMEQHLESPDSDHCGWVIAQADRDGGFNKFTKVLGSAQDDIRVFSTWKAAQDHLKTIGGEHLKIFPVCIQAGREPRTTIPPMEKT